MAVQQYRKDQPQSEGSPGANNNSSCHELHQPDTVPRRSCLSSFSPQSHDEATIVISILQMGPEVNMYTPIQWLSQDTNLCLLV